MVTVTDVNDNPPRFTQSVYSFDIREDALVSSTVARITATDADMGLNGEIAYYLQADNWGSSVFALDRRLGVFTLQQPLDFETTQIYTLTVFAEDAGVFANLSSSAVVYMNVKDTNDNAPVFDPSTYSVEVFENVTVGTSIVTVSASDTDTGTNGEIVYSIVSGDPIGQFRIDPKNGTIYSSLPLDRETMPFYTLTVEASDMAEYPNNRLQGTTQVSVILKDVNDNAPVFTTRNETWVSENMPVGTTIMKVTALDPDAERNSYVAYHLTSNMFSLGPGDGLLKVSGNLDRETKDTYILDITATDKGQPPRSSHQTITVHIRDKNDNNPVFDPQEYQATVSENAAIGTLLKQVSATDRDAGLNGETRYFIFSGDSNGDFKMDSHTGELSVQKKLNYERVRSYTLQIRAEDGGIEPRYDTATVTIEVTDVNDNTPTFRDSPYIAYVQEGVPASDLPVFVCKVEAYDADSPPNNQVTYRLLQGVGDIFRLDTQTGLVTATRTLDRETRDQYELVITAYDSGSPQLTGTGKITVIVQDVNDHTPTFVRTHYAVSIRENLPPNTPVEQVYAVDYDIGNNAAITYRIQSFPGNPFTIHPVSGQIVTMETLDREEQEAYTLVVVATDGGIVPRSSTATVSVQVTDVNDNAPQFEKDLFSYYIRDPTTSADFVAGVTAIDKDVGSNGQIVYSLSDDPDTLYFNINPQTGVLTTKDGLMASSFPRGLRFSVIASDQGQPPRMDIAEVQLTFQSAPLSQYPTFSSSARQFSQSENTPVGNTITTVSATAPSGQGITYHIAAGNIRKTFAVGQTLGNVTLMRPLDYEAVTGYSLWIEARDGSQPPLSSYIKLSITVTDVNDNSPVFERFVYNVSILESNPQGGEVVLDSLSATDADSGPNGQVTYSIVSGNVGNIFSINPTNGRLSTVDSLDREQVDHYVLVIQAADQGTPPRTAQTTVDVTVADKNDNPPQFTKIFRGTIQENANVGAFVMRITSSDLDIGANAIARYSLIVNPDNKFAIDETSGNVTVAGSLDRETKDQYTLTVQALDGSWRITTRVSITIEDQNDNAPQFSNTPYSFNFKELQRQGSPVGTVTATDRDETGPNSMVQYSLKQISEFFDINADSGSIFSKQPLTFDPASLASNRHQLIVVASDQGVPRRSTEVVVTVNIEDANNNAPVFNKTSYFTPVPDNTSMGTRVVRTEAVDSLDYGVNAEVGYQSLPGYNGTSFFTVDATTGWISVAQSLTGQRNRDFVVVIRATDKGTPPQSADVTVHFSVTDVNRNTPRFNSTTFRATIPENRRVGNVVASLSAQDDDQGINGQVEYHITGGDPQGWFAIGETSGMVTIAKPLDYDTTSVTNLTITAKDKGLISKQSSAAFIIQLTDINDNPPVFNQSTYDTYILENSPRGSTVFVAHATDADSNAYADVEYRLEGGAGFTINAETGVIRTQTDLDYETKKLYTMVVRATNPGTSLESTAVLNVHVTGANEDYPKFTRRRYEFIVSESARPGQQVGAVTALDSDQGTEGVVYYFLVGSSNRKGFKIDSLRGTIIVETPLDREVMSSVTLTVMAKNPGSVRGNDTDTCTVYISLEDANDPPLFTETEYTGNVREDAGAGQNVVRVLASDNDLQTSDRQFSYSIESGNDGGAFSVEPVSGWVRTTGARLDRETLPVYNITVVAIDTGSPPQTGSTNVIISLDDVNDNGPIFQPQNLTAYVTEEQDPQQAPVVIQLDSHTTDPDLPPNQGPYTYSLVPNQYSSYFQLQSSNGALRTTTRLDREQISNLDLLIKVTDGGSPQQTSTLTLHVLVNDLNDNPPTPRPLTVSVFAYQGNFPGGLVADVTPTDPDISGSYTCSILQGDRSMFSFSGSSCQLQANQVQSPKDFTLNISSSDGRSSGVTSATLVKFRTVDNTTLENTLVVRLQGLTQETFLRTFRTRFESTLAQYLTSGDSIVLHNLLQRGPNLDLFLAIQQSSGQYRTAATLESTLQSNRNSIQQGSGVIIATINVSPCQSNPCQNNGVCSDDPVVFSTYDQMASLSFILTAPAVQHTHHCQCPAGFTGTNCELDIGQSCGNNVCLHGGTCLDIAGTPTCTCVAGYTGPTCGDDVNECLSNPCPGSECRNTVGSFRCELTGRGFHSLSYMEFQSPLQRDQNNIVLEFATLQQNALLLYNPGSTDFLALEIVAGRVVFSFNLGETDSTKLMVGQYVSNGKWFKVTVSRIQEAGTLKVQLCDPVCRQCNIGDSNCYATGSHDGFQTLDVASGNLSLGGVRDFDLLLQRREVQTYDFVGCLRIAVADGYNLLTGKEKLRASVGVTNTCPRENIGTCTSNVCENGGTCKDEWFGMSCTCRSGFMGDRCELELKSFTFGPNAKVEFIPKESYRRQSLLSAATKRRKRAVGTGSHSMSVTFGTSADGPLFQSTSPSGYTLLGVEEGKLVYQFQEGGTNEKVTVSDKKMDNNVWHNISLSVQGNKVQLKLNDESPVDREFPAVHDFLGLDVTALKLGGKFPDKSEPGFAGCLSDFLLNGEAQPFQGATERFDVQVSGNTSNGCSTGVIGCNACVSGGDCSEQCGAVKATPEPSPISIGVVIVIVFLAVLILGLLITFIVFRARRTMQQKKQHSAEQTKQNGDSVFIVNKAANDSNRTQDSGYTETGEVPEETIIRNHIAEELATKSFQEREISDHIGGLQPPDILGRQTSTVPSQNHQDDDTVIIENGDAFGIPEEALPEHYDIENASSIAPSDIDVITHYRRYRDGKRPHHQRNNHHVPTYHKHSHRHSPNHILNRTARDSPMNQINMSLPRQSPSVMMHQQQQQQARDSPNAMKMQSTPMPRQSPLTVNNPLLRQSPINPMVARHSPMNQLSRTSPIRDMRVSPLGMQLGNRVASPIQEVRVDSDQSSGHGEVVRSPANIPPRPHSRMQQPGGVASRPPMGLTVEEIERLNARQHVSPTSTIDAVSSTTEGRGRPNNINTLEHSGLLEPPESTSDDSSNDSFTCSEFEYENERNRPEFDQFPKLSEAENENEDSPQDSNGRTFTYDGSDSVRGSLSTLLVSEDETLPRPTKSPTGLFNWDYLLNWGPSFEKLVGVFQDIAALPDSEGRSEVKLVPLDVKKDMEEYV
ncbi:cadherin-related tumor suppressor-like [Lingula anatina]|uniref:Cadherin-related tumor suppressor-like n=1 Tax=Lingula anatina TaxID=7574 RepID=A0A1S3HY51_LINAN|nr:cadherin-related tumor suppressor-like [Lingula anatina]|eukprot:XP_013390955.1 cadherin-related tumor suppressor-like [Lingula anatina]